MGAPHVHHANGASALIHAVIVPQMILMGLGMGLISTPATESILLVLPPARERGGTLGVAVVGSLFSSVYAAHLADGLFGRLPAGKLTRAQDSVGAATSVAGGSRGLTSAVQDAFRAGLSTSCVVIGVLCLAAALAATAALPGRSARMGEPDVVPVAA